MKRKMSKVLIPIDDAAFSRQVLTQVTNLLEPSHHELIFLRVAPEPSMVEFGEPGDPDLTIYVDQQEVSLAAEFASEMLPHRQALQNAGFHVFTTMRFGDPANEIERFVDEQDIDLVAMTTHGRTGLDRLVFGSVAEHVLHHTEVPVLLYRSTSKVSPEQELAAYN
jgi:nucleotide-binding universal stress UspA family protein